MAVTIKRKMPNGEIVTVKVVNTSPVSMKQVASKLVLDPSVEFAGNTQFVKLNPNRFFKRQR